jgi:hypothetical protein
MGLRPHPILVDVAIGTNEVYGVAGEPAASHTASRRVPAVIA